MIIWIGEILELVDLSLVLGRLLQCDDLGWLAEVAALWAVCVHLRPVTSALMGLAAVPCTVLCACTGRGAREKGIMLCSAPPHGGHWHRADME